VDLGICSISLHDALPISHSFDFSAIIISNENVGIDLEKQREKIVRIADKFIGSEAAFLHPEATYIENLTVVWGATEAMFKMCNRSEEHTSELQSREKLVY